MEPNAALDEAIPRGDLPAVKAALRAGASPDGPPKARWLPLTSAVLYNQIAIARELLRAGAELKRFKDNWRREGGDLDDREIPMLKFLATLGLDVRTAFLRVAVDNGNLAVAKAALAEGADVNSRGSGRDLPLEMAFHEGHLALVRLLSAAGARLPSDRDSRAYVLERAISHGDLALVKAAFASGIDPRTSNSIGENALLWTAGAGDWDLFKYFMAQGLEPGAAKIGHQSLLDHARKGGHAGLIAYVERLGLTSLADQAAVRARLLRKAFGGRSRIEMSGGEFPTCTVLRPKLDGLGRTEIEIGGLGWQITCEGFTPALPGWGAKSPVWLAVNRTKPVGFLLNKKVAATPGVFASYAAPVVRGEQTSVEIVKRFCRANERAIRELRLGKGEFIFFGLGRMVMRCASDDMTEARRRVEILRQLQVRNSVAPEPQRTLFAREFRFRPSARGPHRLGGTHAAPPACAGCGGPTQLMAELDLTDRALPKTKLRRKTWPVFWCLECCDWDPAFYDVSGEVVVALDAKRSPVAITTLPSTAGLRARRMGLVASPDGKRESPASKTGGTPAWVQSPDVPNCIGCKKPMTFVLQLASDRTISYADVGRLYSFVCPGCRVGCTLVQSH